MNNHLIEIVWTEEDDGFIAAGPDPPGRNVWGLTAAEAATEIEDTQTA